jgi:hypothetical protein
MDSLEALEEFWKSFFFNFWEKSVGTKTKLISEISYKNHLKKLTFKKFIKKLQKHQLNVLRETCLSRAIILQKVEKNIFCRIKK